MNVFWAVLGFFLLLSSNFVNSHNVNSDGRGIKRSLSYNYERIDEVNKHCSFVMKSAAELKPDESRLYTIKDELSFLNGDWWQELDGVGGAALMPFDDRDISISSNDLRSQLNLVSIWVSDVNHFKNSIFVSGVLQLSITLEGLLSEKPHEQSPRFDIWPGHSQLLINFEGIYTESGNSNEERIMCLLGSGVFPSRLSDSSDPFGWVKESGYTNQPLLAQDDQILLVLTYPKTLTFRSRSVYGSMKSLNPKSNLKYFDEVHISSWLSSSANYRFTSQDLVSKVCNSDKDSLFDVYKGLDFCLILERLTHQEALSFLPNWNCNGTDQFCSKLGPFALDKEINATNGSFKNAKLVMQDIRCENMTSKDGDSGFFRVSSVFRAVPPSENQFTAVQRTGISNMTLSAEGIWNSSTGQLCMIGCTGFASNGCDSRICLYIPVSFSIKQRNIVLGSFTSMNQTNGSYFPLAFEKLVRPAELWDEFTSSRPYYVYSKTDAAMVLLEKYEPFLFSGVIRKSLLKFPKIEDEENFRNSVSLLAEDLTLHIPAVPDPFPHYYLTKTDFELEILSVGTFFGHYWPTKENFSGEFEHKQLLNVSGQINLSGEVYGNFSSFFVEGVYDVQYGKMYLVGCRDVRASWQTLFESRDLEAGLDCLVDVLVSYPPTTASWLFNPTAKISISSRRNEDDPLFFDQVKLQTVPVMYRKQREDVLSRRGVEGILRVLTLSFAIACVSSQLFYVKDNTELVPFISLVMLGLQALGYSLPLITGAEALLKRAAEDFAENQFYDLQNSQWIRVIDYTVKFLVLVAFSATLRLCQMVWKARIRTSVDVPSDKRVLVTTLAMHSIGYIVVLLFHYENTRYMPLQTARFIDSSGYSRVIREWQTELEEYLGLVQDLFLVPQVIANLLWRIEVKPLRKLYYIGMTAVRQLPHLYDCIDSPVVNPYFAEEYEFVNPRMEFFSKFGDVAIPVTAIVLAVVIYVQQRWGYEKLSRALVFGWVRLLPMGSKAYEKLPIVEAEAELTSRIEKSHAHEKDHDSE